MRFNFLGIACKQIMQKSSSWDSSEEGSSGTFLGGRPRLAGVLAMNIYNNDIYIYIYMKYCKGPT